MVKNKSRKENTSGNIRLEGDLIFWDYNKKNILQIDSNEIVVMGEYTNSEGPWFDDWFITLVTSNNNWHSIPMYAENIYELTEYLSEKFQIDLSSSQLVNSTNWKSVISYPLHLKNKPLFKLTKPDSYKEPITFIDKILFSIGLGNFNMSENIELSDEIRAIL